MNWRINMFTSFPQNHRTYNVHFKDKETRTVRAIGFDVKGKYIVFFNINGNTLAILDAIEVIQQ